MGIPLLYSFATKDVECLSDIDMIQEIENWSRHNVGKPTIIIDFLSFTYAIVDEDERLDIFFGRGREISLKKMENLFNAFRQKGVNLVFFEDGPLQMDKMQKSITHQNQIIEIVFKILDDLYDCNEVSKLLEKYDLGNVACPIRLIREVARKFGEFHTSYHNECDKEIVAYAIKVNAMAILSDDSDYLIFEGSWSYWSSKHLNFNNLTTKCYDKIALQQHLQLTENEMPLFATLAGNDIISRDLLDRFHRFLGNPRLKFQNISRFIIRNFRDFNSYEPEYIAKKVFSKETKIAEYTELIRKSLNSYNVNMLNDNNDDKFLQRMRSVENDCYAFLRDLAGDLPISLFDVRTPQFEKLPSLALDLIQRQMGIILQHINNKELSRHIFCYQEGQYVYRKVTPQYPEIVVPNLDDLYNSEKNDELKMIKLQLLGWILSNRLNINAIKTIDKKYFCASLSLFYMVENMFITVREADIFLHVLETVYEKFSTIANLPYLERVDPRALQIKRLYYKVYTLVMDAMSNCGLFELIEHNYLDILYFYYAYNKMCESANYEAINIHLGQLRLYD